MRRPYSKKSVQRSHVTGQPGYIRDFGDVTLIFSFSLNFLSCLDVLLFSYH